MEAVATEVGAVAPWKWRTGKISTGHKNSVVFVFFFFFLETNCLVLSLICNFLQMLKLQRFGKKLLQKSNAHGKATE